MDDVKSVYREGSADAKEAWRNRDGEDLSDKIGNAGDRIRQGLGNLGDDIRRNAKDDPDRRDVTDPDAPKGTPDR
jgi:hypothetical protein